MTLKYLCKSKGVKMYFDFSLINLWTLIILSLWLFFLFIINSFMGHICPTIEIIQKKFIKVNLWRFQAGFLKVGPWPGKILKPGFKIFLSLEREFSKSF